MLRINYLLLLCLSFFWSHAAGQAKITVGGSVRMQIQGNSQVTLHDMSMENAGEVSAGDGSVVKLASSTTGAQLTMGGAGQTELQNLVVDVPGGEVKLNGNLEVNGNLTFSNGALNLNSNQLLLAPASQVINESNNGGITDPSGGEVEITVDLNAPNQANPGNLGAIITSSANLGPTTVRRGHIAQTGGDHTGVLRYYDISPANNQNLDATLRFTYLDDELNGIPEGELELWRNPGVYWEHKGFTNRNPSGNYVEISGINSFSRWTLAGTNAPLCEYRYAFTLLGLEEVKLKTSTVFTGGVGVVGEGETALFQQGSVVQTFVQAPLIDLQGGSTAAQVIHQEADVPLPVFLANPNNASNHMDVPENGTMTLAPGIYGKVKVKKNGTLLLSAPGSYFMEELKAEDDAVIQPGAAGVQVILEKKLELDKSVTVNAQGYGDFIFHVGKDANLKKEGISFTADIYAPDGKIKVSKATTGNPTVMQGLFIAKSIESDEAVHWYKSSDRCQSGQPLSSALLTSVLRFDASAAFTGGNAEVNLSWVTNTDRENDRYLVEKSMDGITFSTVAQYAGRSESGVRVYRETDVAPEAGRWLYRLKVIRKDGYAVYSAPVQLHIMLPAEFDVFPNPASGTVYISLKSEAGKAATLQLANSQGKVLELRREDALPESPLEWNLAGLPPGLYWVHIKVDGRRSRAVKFYVE